MLAEELGYEDVDEFEDALKAPFKVFLANLPHVEVRHPRRHFLIPDTFIDATTQQLTISPSRTGSGKTRVRAAARPVPRRLPRHPRPTPRGV
jgi:hypothetical protein